MLASLPGRLLEAVGNGGPRGMAAHDRTRLIGGLPLLTIHFYFDFYPHCFQRGKFFKDSADKRRKSLLAQKISLIPP